MGKGKLCLAVILAIGGCPLHAVGQVAGPAPYLPQVWDIDWSYLARPTGNAPVAQRDWTDRLHYIPLRNARNYLSVTGQIRERGEYQDHPAWGAQPPDNGYLLQRYLLSGDLHLGQRFRFFLQMDSGLIDGRDGGPRPGTDEDKLDINQGFLDVVPVRHGDKSLTVRAGRQLLSLGSTRLVATGVGLNVEQPFDGFRLTWKDAKWLVEGLAVRPVTAKTGIFDNEPNAAEELFGVYVTRAISKRLNVDAYYLALDHKSARYTQGIGREQRETIGGRVWSHTATWDYDFEYTGQLGWFGANDNIRAWGTGYHVGYTFAKAKFAPKPELDGGVLSGDSNAKDTTLGTFNPLFPNGNYLNEAILLGPYNLIITRPTVKLALTNKMSSNTNVEVLWREAVQDGVYNIVGILTHPANGSSARLYRHADSAGDHLQLHAPPDGRDRLRALLRRRLPQAKSSRQEPELRLASANVELLAGHHAAITRNRDRPAECVLLWRGLC